jgi:hypothetical protein
MTDAAPSRRARLSKGRVRAVAWVTGGATLVTGIGILGTAPKPASSIAAPEPQAKQRPVVIVKKVLRRVIITDPPAAAAPITILPGSSTSTSSTGSTGGGGPASAPAIATSTGGS